MPGRPSFQVNRYMHCLFTVIGEWYAILTCSIGCTALSYASWTLLYVIFYN